MKTQISLIALVAFVYIIPLDAFANDHHRAHHPPPPKVRLEKRCHKATYEEVWVEETCQMVRHKKVCRPGHHKRIKKPGYCEMVEVPVHHRR